MPLDADEVDSAMERFIRKKYQEKSLSDGRPEPPRRDETIPTAYSRPQEADSPPPPLPPKKGKLFGFSLRTSSSSYSLSKHDKKKLPKAPRVDESFHIPNDDYNSMSRMADARYEMTDADLQKKLNKLRDMGFEGTERNTALLRKLNGNVERTIETLVRLASGERNKSSTTRRTQRQASAAPTQTTTPSTSVAVDASQSSEPSYNPFLQVANQQTVGLSMGTSQGTTDPSNQVYGSNNPFGQVPRSQTDLGGLEHSFQSMQVAQPLFPHSTGGYPSQPAPFQDPRLQYSMTPPVPSTHFQQGYVASPAAIPMSTNPFFQPAPASAQSTGSNPFFQQGPPVALPSSPSMNPFYSFPPAPTEQPAQSAPRQNSLPASFNPFGIPPAQAPQTAQPSMLGQSKSQDPFGTSQQLPFRGQTQPNNPFQPQQIHHQPQQQAAPGFPNFQYGPPQTQPQAQTQMAQFQQQASYQQQFNQQGQALMPQQTGRHDKNSIMALYNYPQLAPQPLASIPEPAETAGSQARFQQQTSPAPSSDIFGQAHTVSPAKRSATMPVSLSSMHSAGGGGSRNPFFTHATNTNVNASNSNASGHLGSMPSASGAQGQAQSIAARHASRESVLISNLDGGRHSPDAFANLSSSYAR